MTRVTIDGNHFVATYRCQCECGDSWHGTAEPFRPGDPSPALPIAEVIVHMRLAHGGALVDIQFTQRFKAWLLWHWEKANDRAIVTPSSL